ncbi:MAG: hypothetical protein ACON4E_03855 [Flavobacteriales bacterium]
MINKYSILFFLTFVLVSCTEKDDIIPNVYVNFRIQASEIGGVGNAIYTSSNYGVKGIIIYHKYSNEYVAYERCCSYKANEDCAVVELDNEISPTFLIDSCCTSKFLLEDGTPFDGPALLPLKQYATYFDGTYIQISN